MSKRSIFALVTNILDVRGNTVNPDYQIPEKHQTKTMAVILEALVDKFYRDHNTGLPNYQAFTQNLLNLILERRDKKRAGVAVPPDTVVFLDINYFKDFNTELGHITTDGLIKSIASVISTHARHGDENRLPDMIARAKKGGDEFLILLPGCNKENARSRIENLCADIRKKIFITPCKNNRGYKVTNISLAAGYYELDSKLREEDGETYDTPHSAIDKADARMRKRKRKMKENDEAAPPQIEPMKKSSLLALKGPDVIEVEPPELYLS